MTWSGTEIRKRREARGLTQKQLADAIGASRRAVVAWELGETAPQGRFSGHLDRVLGGPPRPHDDGPLLRDASFHEAIGHLMALYGQAVRAAGGGGDGFSTAAEIPPLEGHQLLEGPDDGAKPRRSAN